MKESCISVFVDESGSFDPEVSSSRYYLICLVLHDQNDAIDGEVAKLEDSMEAIGVGRNHSIHAGPLIRREREYSGMGREERRAIMSRMMSFIRKAPFSYECFALDKKYISNGAAIHDSLLQMLVRFLIDRSDRLNGYDRLRIYYDNGQSQVKDLLVEAFAIYASRTEFAVDVHPDRYRLFQVADTLCTLELARLKLQAGDRLSNSEFEFFGGVQNLKRYYLKPIVRKRIV